MAMPYVRCPNCRLSVYTASGYSSRDRCPRCGDGLPDAVRGSDPENVRAGGRFTALAPFPRRDSSGDLAPVSEARTAVADDDPIRRALGLACEQLDMDLALLQEVREEDEVIVRLAGDNEWLDVVERDAHPLDDTYCKRLLEGVIGAIVADAQHDERVSDLEATRRGIGAYIGVPLRAADMRVYVLCCMAREARPALAEADVRFLRGLAETVVSELNATSA
jgi:hypothetical protein